jgi:hypothetical protein
MQRARSGHLERGAHQGNEPIRLMPQSDERTRVEVDEAAQ